MPQEKKKMIINLTKSEVYESLRIAKKFSKKESWSKKNDKFSRWGAGLLNMGKISYKAELIGTLGEMSFSKVSKLPIDSEYKERGNNFDFKAKLLPVKRKVYIEVKTRMRDMGDVYVKRYDENDKMILLKSDIYVFCHLITSWNRIEKDITNDENMGSVKVKIDGVISKKKLEAKDIYPAFNGVHKNIVCPTTELANIDELLKLIVS